MSTAYKLTIRRGARVERESFELLADAVATAERELERVRAAGPLDAVKALREFAPAARVAARLEISTGGRLRGAAAGVDVMGDGEVVAFAGGVRREPLEPRDGEAPLDAVRRELDRSA